MDYACPCCTLQVPARKVRLRYVRTAAASLRPGIYLRCPQCNSILAINNYVHDGILKFYAVLYFMAYYVANDLIHSLFTEQFKILLVMVFSLLFFLLFLCRSLMRGAPANWCFWKRYGS